MLRRATNLEALKEASQRTDPEAHEPWAGACTHLWTPREMQAIF